MSHFYCSECGALISDSPRGYISGCPHYPLEGRKQVHCVPPERPRQMIFPDDFDSHLDEANEDDD